MDVNGRRAFLILCCAVLCPRLSASTVITTFAGLNGSQNSVNGFSVSPPDTMGSVGPNAVFETVNLIDQGYTKPPIGTTPSPSGSLLTGQNFWSNAGVSIGSAGNLSDPRIVYDPGSGRWFAAEITVENTNNRLLVAVSNNSDPINGGWQGGALTAVPSHFGDQPLLSVNRDAINIGLNDFTNGSPGGNFSGISDWSIPKSDLVLATPSFARATDLTSANGLTSGFSPDLALDTGSSTTGWLFTAGTLGPSAAVTTYSLTNQGTATPGLTQVNTLTLLGGNEVPVKARQPGDGGTATIDTGDERFNSTPVRVGNDIVLVHTYGSSTGGNHDIVQWAVLDVSGALPVIVNQGTIDDPNFDFYYPSATVTADGSLVMTFNRSGRGAGGNISVFAEICTNFNSLAASACTSPFSLAAGTVSNFTDVVSPSRFGDYSATVLDPSNAFLAWSFQEIPFSSTVWGTQITEIEVVVPEPYTMALAGIGVVWLARRCRRKKTAR